MIGGKNSNDNVWWSMTEIETLRDITQFKLRSKFSFKPSKITLLSSIFYAAKKRKKTDQRHFFHCSYAIYFYLNSSSPLFAVKRFFKIIMDMMLYVLNLYIYLFLFPTLIKFVQDYQNLSFCRGAGPPTVVYPWLVAQWRVGKQCIENKWDPVNEFRNAQWREFEYQCKHLIIHVE